MKRFTAFFLALILCLSLFSVTAFADADLSFSVSSSAFSPSSGELVLAVGETKTIQVTFSGMGMCTIDYRLYDISGDPQAQDEVIVLDPTFLNLTSPRNLSGTFSVTGSDNGESVLVLTAGSASASIHITVHTHSLSLCSVNEGATCTEDGILQAHYACGCGKRFKDVAGEQEITSGELSSYVVPSIGHNFTGDAVYNEDDTHSFQCVNGDCTAKGVMNDTTPVEYEAGVEGYETCTDNNADHKCDECDRVMSECKDEDGNDLCDICGKDLTEPEPECKLPGFIGWIMNSMLRVVRLIIARITFEKYEPVIIGGAIVKIVWDAFAR